MNIIRAEENALLIWNLQKARTAYISGEELAALNRWANGADNAFADRLMSLGVISEHSKQEISGEIKKSREIKSPANAFCAPESIHIELTERCLLNCPMCYKKSTAHELPLHILSETIKQAGEARVFQIALGGGEPLLYPELLTAIKEISRYEMASSITTSGAGLTVDLIEALKEAGINHIQISLNGSTKEVHSLSRDGFENGIDALRVLRHSGLSYGINWVARRDNIDDFPALAELAKAYNAGNLNILRYKPSPKEEYQSLSAEKNLLLEKFIKTAKGIRIKVDSAYSFLRCKINKRTSFMSGCGAGRRFIALSACGSFMPCSHIDLKEPHGSLREIWYNSENLSLFRNADKCAEMPDYDCEYLHGCYGCRACARDAAAPCQSFIARR